jgi:hypothetical protein
MPRILFPLKFSLTEVLDAAVVLGMILLNEAHRMQGDPSKKRSECPA